MLQEKLQNVPKQKKCSRKSRPNNLSAAESHREDTKEISNNNLFNSERRAQEGAFWTNAFVRGTETK